MIFRAVYKESALPIHENDLSELSRKMSSISILSASRDIKTAVECLIIGVGAHNNLKARIASSVNFDR